jgi:hypothetical protein
MTHEKSSKDVRVGFAWYRPEQWARLLDVSIDRDTLEDTHAEWEEFATQRLRELRSQGVDVEKIEVDVEELKQWCLDHGSLVDAGARSKFVIDKLKEKHGGK